MAGFPRQGGIDGTEKSSKHFPESSSRSLRRLPHGLMSSELEMVACHDGENAAPFPLTETDREQLALDDAEFDPHTWEELKQIIGVMNSLCQGYGRSDLDCS